MHTPDHTPPDGLGSILIAEYENMHSRVFQQMASFESSNVKIFMLYGVLLWFSLSYYDDPTPYLETFVDIIYFVLYPVLLAGVVALTVANMGKIMILGDYLMIIENKINKAYAAEALACGFRQDHFEFVMGWEYWRLKFGNNKKGNAYTEATLGMAIIVLEVAATIVCAVIRMKYLRQYQPERVGRAWLMLGVALALLALVCLWGARQYGSRRKQAAARADRFYNPHNILYTDLPDPPEEETAPPEIRPTAAADAPEDAAVS
ncbi:MAG: hypothetical protein IK116_01785 [Firmicutes bacterium]|nr:hypothetical protein [Bacillota bacterium]